MLKALRSAAVFAVTMTAVVFAQAPPAAPAPPVLAIQNVTLIPMDSERVLRDHTVIVEGRRITAVGPSSATAVPEGATRIEGRGRFLIPGLAEMHGHFPSPQGLEQYGEAFGDRLLYLNVACGVTTVRGMIGGPRDLRVREEVARGLRIGPQIFTAGPSINGTSVPDARTAWRVVTEQRAAGYDLLKIHPGVPRAAFDEVARTARAEGIPFAGHIPADVGLVRALLSGIRTVEHLDGYVEALQKDGAALPAQTGFFGSSIVDTVDEAKIAPLAAATRAAGAWNTPTQVLLDNLYGGASLEEIAARPEMRYVPAAMREQWRTGAQQFRGPDYDAARGRRFVDLRRRLLRALRDAGAGPAAGRRRPAGLQRARLRDAARAGVAGGGGPHSVPGPAGGHAQPRDRARGAGLVRHRRGRPARRPAAAGGRPADRHPQRVEARGSRGRRTLAARGGAGREARGIRPVRTAAQ